MPPPTIHDAMGHHQAGRPEEASAIYRAILAVDPANVDALHLLGVAHRAAGRLEEACACIGRAVELSPDFAVGHGNLANALRDLGRFEEAERAYRRAIEIDPGFAGATGNLGALLAEQNRLGDALAMLARAVALAPDDAGANGTYGAVLWLAGDLEPAVRHLERAAALDPRDAKVRYNLGIALFDTGDADRAITCYRQAIALRGGAYATAHSSLIFALESQPSVTPEERRTERARWHAANRRPRPAAVRWPNPPDPERRLRVGYVSGDFRRHSASLCFGPVVRGHDRGRFEVFCYVNNIEADDVTERFRQAADHWCPVVGVGDDALERLIRQHGIDILVDLSGHTARSRLPVFTAKPAPVQITAWGFATDPGVPELDYLLTDPIVLPPGERGQLVSAALDLPCAISLPMSEDGLPDVEPRPADAPPTFGCLNRFSKVTDATLGAWARILAGSPGSRLLLKDRVFSDAAMRARSLDRLGRIGIPSDRVTLLGATDRTRHLMAYREVDVALDPFPQNGGISTLESLWMGVPVVTRIGDSAVSRLAASILAALGMTDHVADSDVAYVRIAVERAVRRDAADRTALRARLASSPVGNAALYTAAVEDAYRAGWHRWCATQAAAD